jgi:hypothetical protein
MKGQGLPKDRVNRGLLLLESIKPDLLRVLENAPPYGSCGVDIFFHDSEIVRIMLKAEVSKLASREPSG